MGCIMSIFNKSPKDDSKLLFYKAVQSATNTSVIYKQSHRDANLQTINNLLTTRLKQLLTNLRKTVENKIKLAAEAGYNTVYVIEFSKNEVPIRISNDTKEDLLSHFNSMNLNDFISINIKRKVNITLTPHTFIQNEIIQLPTSHKIIEDLQFHFHEAFIFSFDDIVSPDGTTGYKLKVRWTQ